MEGKRGGLATALAIVGLLIAGVIGKTIGRGAANAVTRNEAERQLTPADLEDVARVANKRLPQKMAEHVGFERVEAGPGLRLTFHYKLLQPGPYNLSLIKQQMQAIVDGVCGGKSRDLLRKGLVDDYRYTGPDGLAVTNFEIDEPRCIREAQSTGAEPVAIKAWAEQARKQALAREMANAKHLPATEAQEASFGPSAEAAFEIYQAAQAKAAEARALARAADIEEEPQLKLGEAAYKAEVANGIERAFPELKPWNDYALREAIAAGRAMAEQGLSQAVEEARVDQAGVMQIPKGQIERAEQEAFVFGFTQSRKRQVDRNK